MRFVSFFVTFPITVVVVLFAISNREAVPLNLWPLPQALEAPLYLVALLSLLLGFILGGTIAWTGELGNKSRARKAERRAEDLDRELEVMRIREEEIRSKTLPSASPTLLADGRGR